MVMRNVGAHETRGDKECMPLQWRNQFWQSLEEGAGKRCSEGDIYIYGCVAATVGTAWMATECQLVGARLGCQLDLRCDGKHY